MVFLWCSSFVLWYSSGFLEIFLGGSVIVYWFPSIFYGIVLIYLWFALMFHRLSIDLPLATFDFLLILNVSPLVFFDIPLICIDVPQIFYRLFIWRSLISYWFGMVSISVYLVFLWFSFGFWSLRLCLSRASLINTMFGSSRALRSYKTKSSGGFQRSR